MQIDPQHWDASQINGLRWRWTSICGMMRNFRSESNWTYSSRCVCSCVVAATRGKPSPSSSTAACAWRLTPSSGPPAAGASANGHDAQGHLDRVMIFSAGGPPASIEHDDTCHNQLRGTHAKSDWPCMLENETYVPLERLHKCSLRNAPSLQEAHAGTGRSRDPRLPAPAWKSLSKPTHVWHSRGCTMTSCHWFFLACRCTATRRARCQHVYCQDFCTKSHFHET